MTRGTWDRIHWKDRCLEAEDALQKGPLMLNVTPKDVLHGGNTLAELATFITHHSYNVFTGIAPTLKIEDSEGRVVRIFDDAALARDWVIDNVIVPTNVITKP